MRDFRRRRPPTAALLLLGRLPEDAATHECLPSQNPKTQPSATAAGAAACRAHLYVPASTARRRPRRPEFFAPTSLHSVMNSPQGRSSARERPTKACSITASTQPSSMGFHRKQRCRDRHSVLLMAQSTVYVDSATQTTCVTQSAAAVKLQIAHGCCSTVPRELFETGTHTYTHTHSQRR